MSQSLTPFSAARLLQLRGLDDLLLGATYAQTAWAKAQPEFPDGAARAEEVARIMAADQINFRILLPDDDEPWMPDHLAREALLHYSPQTLAALGRRVRQGIPDSRVEQMRAQVAALHADVEARKGQEAELQQHLRDAYDETRAARSRAARLQDQINECDCEE